MKLTNKDLRGMFRRLNARFFDGQLDKDTPIRFTRNLESDGLRVDATYDPDDGIQIDSLFRGGTSYVEILVLHEMIHAVLPDYKGQKEDGDHGTLFQGWIFRLIQAGAYDGLL